MTRPTVPAGDSYFGYAAYADAVAEIIDSERTDTPLTIAVSGAWGAGKTSLAVMVESRLSEWTTLRRGERPMTICWFRAWLHDDAPHLGAALAAQVARVASRRRRWWQRLLFPLPEALLGPSERWRRRAALLLGLLALTAIAAAAPPTHKIAHDLALPKVVGGSLAVVAFVALILWRKLFAAAQDAAGFVQAPQAEAGRGALGRARDQLRRLIGQARRDGRFVIFVDDLERCRPPRAIEVCEVASQLLAHPGVVTVLLADMEAIAASAQMKYKDLADAQGPRRIGREYLEKMVQLQLTLPPPRPVDMVAMLTDHPPLLQTTAHERPAGSVLAATATGTSSELDERVVDVGVVVVGVVVGFVRQWRLKAAADRRRRMEERIRELADETDQSDLEARALTGVKPSDADLVRKEVRSYLTDEAEELREVEAVIVEYPPVLPRSAKRMLNHARLLTRIARDRSVFTGDPPLTPPHLGKWIVLSERWWALAQAVKETPS